MQQLQYDYICLRCGRRLIPEGESGDDTAPVLFDLSEALGIADANDNSRSIPIYFTAEELRGIVEDPASDGGAFMKASLSFETFMDIVAKRSDVPELATITADDMKSYLVTRHGDSEHQAGSDEFDYGESNDSENSTAEAEITADDEEKNKRIDEILHKCGASDAVGDFGSGQIDKFCQVVSSLFFDVNNNSVPYVFQIKVNLSAMGKPGTKVGYTYKVGNGEEQFPRIPVICGEVGCWRGRHNDAGAPVPPMAWQNEHIAIGFIGAAGSGKTCLITALLSKLLSNGKLVDGDKRDEIQNCIKAYESNRELPKTELEGRNSFNATVACNDKLVTLVDISGECFDMASGRFDRNVANDHFKMIRICKCYVLCLDPKNSIYDGKGLAAQSIGEFVEYLKTRERRYAAPMLLTLTKCDCEEDTFENFDTTADLDNVAAEIRFESFFEKSSEKIRRDYPQFFSNVSNDAYIACALSSAYGCEPKPDERNMPSIAKLRDAFKGKTIYLTGDGRYYVSSDSDRRDYSVPKNLSGQSYVVKRTECGVEYIFDPTSEERSEGSVKKLSDLRLKPDQNGINSGVGTIFDSDEYLDSPNPLNIKSIMEWLLRVCGVDQIKYLEFDEERGKNVVYEYQLRSSDVWSREEPKTARPELARSVCALFRNPTKLDRWTSDHSNNAGSRMMMTVIEKLGLAGMEKKLLSATKDWREE